MSEVEFGRYRLIELLGRGGMGEVWRAFDTVTERVVALKVLPAEFAGDPVFQERFRREAKSAAGLDEPHVVPIHDFGEIDGRLYVTMRLIQGRDLQGVLTEGRIEPARAVAIIDQVASALHAAHRVNLVHRDVKPSNILVSEDDFAYLIDFGIARAEGQSGLTGTSNVIGTWAYMAPERISTGHSDARADIYALACVLYECLTGRQPFGSESLEQQIGGHLTASPPRASERQPDVPAALDAVIAKGMAKHPDDRYATTRELALAARGAVTAPLTAPEPVPPPTFAPRHNVYPYANTGAVTNYPAPPPSGPSPSDPTQYRSMPYAATGPVGPMGAQAPPPSGPTPSGATQYPPMPYAPAPVGPKPSRKGRVIALSTLGVLAIVVAVVAAIALNSRGQDASHAPSTSPTPSALPNTGPFTGTFTLAMGPLTNMDGSHPSDAGFSETWRLRSACGTNGCMATASTGGRYPAKDLVFDNVSGRWLAVSNSRLKCKNRDDDEAWDVILLQPQADGTMSGEVSRITTNGCASKRAVTVTRISDTDIALLPDPAALPRRVVSPAEALVGAYDAQVSYASGHKNNIDHYRVRTDCIRSGDRCMSHFVDPNTGNGETFVFGNGTWTGNEEIDSQCSSGGASHTTFTTTLPLPQPPQSPITLLAGHGYADVKPGTKCTSQAYDETFTRTGD